MSKTARPIRFLERYPGPWSVEPMAGGYRIISASGVAIAFIYARDDLAKLSRAEHLTRAEALSLARAITQLPDLYPRATSPAERAARTGSHE